jgi:hypothetical protein
MDGIFGFGRKQSWPNRVIILEFSWRNWRKVSKTLEQLVSWVRFDPSTSQTQVYSVTARPTCLVWALLDQLNNKGLPNEECVLWWKLIHEYLWQSVGLPEHLVACFAVMIVRMIRSTARRLLERNGRFRRHRLDWSGKLQCKAFQICHSLVTHHRHIVYSLQYLQNEYDATRSKSARGWQYFKE